MTLLQYVLADIKLYEDWDETSVCLFLWEEYKLTTCFTNVWYEEKKRFLSRETVFLSKYMNIEDHAVHYYIHVQYMYSALLLEISGSYYDVQGEECILME